MKGRKDTRLTRRDMLVQSTAALAGGALLLKEARAQSESGADVPGAARPREKSAADTRQEHAEQTPMAPGKPDVDYRPVIVPNGTKL